LTDANYAITYTDAGLTVARAPLTVTADPKTKAYGQANPAFTDSCGGLRGTDTPASLGGALSFTTAATATSPAGSYAGRRVG
jgi:hypothetical protein